MFKESKIKSVTPIGSRVVADITVADDHSYVGNGIVNHNSSRNPNLQNLPSRAKLTSKIAIEVTDMVKDVFIPPTNHYIVQFDFSQAELRVVASFANERTMLDAYKNGEDLHKLTASKILKMSLDEFKALSKEKQADGRFKAKAVNFGLIYLQSAEGFVDYAWNNYKVKLTLQEAKEWIAAFFELYPEIPVYHQTYIAKAKKFGYVRTLFGRKRHLLEINAPDDYIRAMDERASVNSPIQGTAGELTILSLALLWDRLDPRVKFVNTIHDSMIYYVPYDLLEDTKRIVKETIEDLPLLRYFGKELKDVNMVIDVEGSDVCWKQMKEM